MTQEDLEVHAERPFLIRQYGKENGFKTNASEGVLLRKFSLEDQGILMAKVVLRERTEAMTKGVAPALTGECAK
jgi:hypothetical protein